MSDPKRLTDEQVREIKKLLDGHAPPRATYLNQMSDLLADREALLAEIEQCHAKATCMCGSYMSEHTGWEGHTGVSMYDYALYQTQERVHLLEAENANLRKVVKYAPSELDPAYYGMAEQIAYRDALDALDAKDATDDKG